MNPAPVGPSRPPETVSPQETPVVEGTFGSEAPLAPVLTSDQTTTETQPVALPATPQNLETPPVTPSTSPASEPVLPVATSEQITETNITGLGDASQLVETLNQLQQ